MSLLILIAIAVLILAGLTVVVIGLASASWQVLLVLLLAILLIPEWLLWQNQREIQKSTSADVPIPETEQTTSSLINKFKQI